MRGFVQSTGVASLLLVTGCQVSQKVTISAPQNMSAGSWLIAPGETQSTVVRYGKPGGVTVARILISNDQLPKVTNQPFMPTGAVAFQDIGSKGPVQSSTFQQPPECVSTATASTGTPACDWAYISNDQDLISDGLGVVYFMPGAGYDGPSQGVITPPWFVSAHQPNATFRNNIGPNTRAAVAVWKSVDFGKTFQWSSFFDPTAYYDGSCGYPQYRGSGNNVTPTPPWDMGGSDGQAAWADPVTGRIMLTFRCVGYKPQTQMPWSLGSTLEENGNYAADAQAQVGEMLLGTFDGNKWAAVAMPGIEQWRTGIIPYKKSLLIGLHDGLAVVDPATSQQAVPPPVWAPQGPIPQPAWGWGSDKGPNFIHTNMDGNTLVTRWGAQGYALVYPSNNAASGAPLIAGATVYYFLMSNAQPGGAQSNSGSATPNFSDLPVAINPLNPGGYVLHLAAIDLGSGTTLLYWVDVDTSTQKGSVRGRLLLDDQLYSQDFEIAPSHAMRADNNYCLDAGTDCYWYGDYHTAGGYCSSDGKNITSTFFPVWIDPNAGGVQYAQVTSISALGPTGLGPLAPACTFPAPTMDLNSSAMDRLPPKTVSLEQTRARKLAGSVRVDPTKISRQVGIIGENEREDR